MTTTIEDNALSAELQELLLITKQWSSDLQFICNESDMLKNLAKQPLEPEVNRNHAVLLSSLEQQIVKLKLKIIHLQKVLAPLAYGPIKEIKLSLIEEHQLVKLEVEEILRTFHANKNQP